MATANINESTNVDGIQLEEQVSTSNPPAGNKRLYTTADGIILLDSDGTVHTLAEYEVTPVNINPDSNRDFHYVGTIYVNGATNTAFICTDNATNNAVWHRQVAHVTDTDDPTTTDDDYPVGTTWINTADNRSWVCLDNTASTAVWQLNGGAYRLELSLTSAFAVTTTTNTPVEWDDQIAGETGWHSTVTNPERITPTRAGMYRISLLARWDANNTGIRLLDIRKNGVQIAGDRRAAAGLTEVTISSPPVEMNGTTDYIEVRVLQSSGGTLDLSSTSLLFVEFVGVN